MEEYIAFVKKRNRRRIVKLMLFCALFFFAAAFIAYSNTRYNGFADVHPGVYYYEKLQELWQCFCTTLYAYDGRFLHF